jgi:hypothetical protein
MKHREPLTLGLIAEGRFLQAANEDLLDMQAKLLEYTTVHGDEAKGAKARLIIEITLAVEAPKDEMFSIRAVTKTALPSRPASVTLAVADETRDGAPCLAVRRSGSDELTPRQGKLATADGRVIDQESGKATAAGNGQ